MTDSDDEQEFDSSSLSVQSSLWGLPDANYPVAETVVQATLDGSKGFLKSQSTIWNKRTGTIVGPDLTMPVKVLGYTPCLEALGCCKDSLVAATDIVSIAHIIAVFHDIISPRGLKACLGHEPLLSISMLGSDTVIYVLATTVQKGPFICDFILCDGPQVVQELPMEVKQCTMEVGGSTIPHFMTEAAVAVKALRSFGVPSLVFSKLIHTSQNTQMSRMVVTEAPRDKRRS